MNENEIFERIEQVLNAQPDSAPKSGRAQNSQAITDQI